MDADQIRRFKPSLMGLSSRSPGFGTMIVAFVAAVHLGRITINSDPVNGTVVRLALTFAARPDDSGDLFLRVPKKAVLG